MVEQMAHPLLDTSTRNVLKEGKMRLQQGSAVKLDASFEETVSAQFIFQSLAILPTANRFPSCEEGSRGVNNVETRGRGARRGLWLEYSITNLSHVA